MPVNEVNITINAEHMPHFNMIAAAYRIAPERSEGKTGIFTLDPQKYDQYDALIAGLNVAIDRIPEVLDPNTFVYNINIHNNYGDNLWNTLNDLKPETYTVLYQKLHQNPNIVIRTHLTRQQNNPLHNQTYCAAINGLTGVELPVSLEYSHPHTWFTLQKVFTEAYNPPTALGRPTMDTLKQNTLLMDQIQENTPEAYHVIQHALNKVAQEEPVNV